MHYIHGVACSWVCMCRQDKTWHWLSLHFFLKWGFSMKLSLMISATPFELGSCASELPVSASQALSYRHTAPSSPAFYVHPGDVNSNPYDYTARSPPTEGYISFYTNVLDDTTFFLSSEMWIFSDVNVFFLSFSSHLFHLAFNFHIIFSPFVLYVFNPKISSLWLAWGLLVRLINSFNIDFFHYSAWMESC